MNKDQIVGDFKSSFSIGKVLAFVALTLVAGVIIYFLKKTPAKAVIEKLPGQ